MKYIITSVVRSHSNQWLVINEHAVNVTVGM